MRILLVCLTVLSAAVCGSRTPRQAQAQAIAPAAIEKLRAHKTFTLIESKDLPPGTPDPGLGAHVRSVLLAAGLREDPSSALRISFTWRGQAVPYDYRTYRGNESLPARYTGASISGTMTWTDSGSERVRRDFAVAIRPLLDFQFLHKDHMASPSEAPFRDAVLATHWHGDGPASIFTRTAARVYGESVVRWVIAQPDRRLQHLGAELAGELKAASLRPVLERLAAAQTMESPNPENPAALALGELPPDPRTTALLKQIARSHSMAWADAFKSLVKLREDQNLPELIDIMTIARVPLPEEGLRLLEHAHDRCASPCERHLTAYRKRLLEDIAELEKGRSPHINLAVLKAHLPLVDRTLERLKR